MPLKDTLLALLVIGIWGLNVIAIKLAVAEMPPLLLMTLRFILVALILVPFYRVPRQQWPFLILLSVTFGSLHFALLFIGLQQAEAGTGALLVQMGTPFATLLAVVFLKEQLNTRKVLGLIAAFSGVIVLAGGPNLPHLMPMIILLCSAMGWAISQLLIKQGPPIKPLALAGWVALFSVPQLALASALFESGQWQAMKDASLTSWGGLLYTVFLSSIVAYGLWYGLLRRHPVNLVVPFTLLMPVLAVLLGIWLMGDPMNLYKGVGGLLVVSGLGFIVMPWPLTRRSIR